MVSLAILAVALLALGRLQYRWIDEVSRAEEARASSRIGEVAKLVSDALDAEVTRAGLVFTLPPAPASELYEELQERWASWNHEAHWPGIVSGVLLVESTQTGWRTRTLGEPGAFDVDSIPPANVFTDSQGPGRNGSLVIHSEFRISNAFIGGQPYLARPIPGMQPSSGAPRMNYAVIHYNLDYLANDVFPRLLEMHSTAGDRIDFRFQITSKNSTPADAILVADQFHYRPDCLMPQGGEDVGVATSRFEGSGRSGVSDFGSISRERVPVSWVLHAAGQCYSAAPPSNAGLMQLSVRRPQGNLRDMYVGFRRRNEIVSALVLLVLVAALAALLVSAERARRLARMQTVVAAGISHELRTPLASLSVAADHLRNGHVENVGQARRYGDIIEAQARKLGHVVDQALALTKLSQSRSVPDSHAVSVPEIIRAAIDGSVARLREASIELEWHTEPDMPMILGDSDLVLRCLANLLENSIKYAGSGGWIRISAQAPTHTGRAVVEMTVEDRGPGIPDGERNAVFEPFYRGSSARQSRQSGSGLGLAIVKSAVEAHGGWIALDRAIPHGCKFTLFFPAANPANAVQSRESEVQHDAVPSDIAG